MVRDSVRTGDSRREQILDGALAVFARQGFSATSIKAVAREAGISSPALLYHYFESKDALLRAVIERNAPPFRFFADRGRVMELPIRRALLEFANAYLAIVDRPEMTCCMRVMIGEALRSPEFAEMLGEIGPQRIWTALSEYFSSKMEAGELRRSDPLLAAQAFISPLFTHVFVHAVARMSHGAPHDMKAFAEGWVDLFLKGCEPASERLEANDE
jgi:AcrR family transcriptional regulator